jgi:hypothetical protein
MVAGRDDNAEHGLNGGSMTFDAPPAYNRSPAQNGKWEFDT